jgi:hypothetical protein
MSCVAGPARTAATYLLLLLSGAVTDVGFAARAAHADDTTPSRQWCIARGDLPPDCAHNDLFSCSIAALLSGGSCVKVEQSLIPATTPEATAPEPTKRKVVRRKPSTAQDKSSAAQHDELFREFERWKRTNTN